eukprot:3679092-Rhodomonas_salina.1
MPMPIGLVSTGRCVGQYRTLRSPARVGRYIPCQCAQNGPSTDTYGTALRCRSPIKRYASLEPQYAEVSPRMGPPYARHTPRGVREKRRIRCPSRRVRTWTCLT